MTARGASAETRINSLTGKVAGLEAEIQETNEHAADIEDQARQLTVALNAALDQRNRLQNERAKMAGEVGDLRQQLTSLQESQANFVANLAERARGNIDMMEKTVAMTGLDVDKLLQTVFGENSGEGGPFIPAPAPRAVTKASRSCWPASRPWATRSTGGRSCSSSCARCR